MKYGAHDVREVMTWIQSGDYDRIQRGAYRTREQDANVREDARHCAASLKAKAPSGPV